MICKHDRLARACELCVWENTWKENQKYVRKLEQQNAELAEALRKIEGMEYNVYKCNTHRIYDAQATAREVLRKYGLEGEEE